MVTLNADHPEIEKYIEWKLREEEKVRALVKMGYSADFNGEAMIQLVDKIPITPLDSQMI